MKKQRQKTALRLQIEGQIKKSQSQLKTTESIESVTIAHLKKLQKLRVVQAMGVGTKCL